MVKLEFKNAVVKDSGYGLSVNGKELDQIISTALGTRVGGRAGYGSGLPNFESTCCNVTVIIDPQPVTTLIEDDAGEYSTVEALEEFAEAEYERIKAENAEAD